MSAARRLRHEPPREPPVVAGRVPPHNLEAEAAVISACLMDRDALDTCLELLQPDHFYSDAHRLIFKGCAELSEAGTPIDIVSVAGWLRDRQQTQRVGGVTYLGEITDATPAVANVATHAQIVVEKWRLRRLIAICQKYAAEGYGDVGDIGEFLDAAEHEIHQVTHTAATSSTVPVKQVLTTVFAELSAAAERGDAITGTTTGFVDLDKKTAGLHEGDLMIIAARPGMGKTALALNIATAVASPTVDGTDNKAEHGVVVFTMEMPKEQLATRLVCSEARVDLGLMRQGRLSQEHWGYLTAAARHLSSLPLLIDDTSALTLLQLRAKVRRAQSTMRRNGQILKLVVIDYLQLMRGRRDAGSREQEISEISRGLKELAKDLKVPVIALAQLNRGVETRGGKDKRPLLSDLRESGAIEQDADTIVFIYRDEYYNRETTTDRGLAELIVRKQRNGPTGTVRVRFVASYTRFENLASGDYEQMEAEF